MLIVYNKHNQTVVSISGIVPFEDMEIDPEVALSILPANPLPEDRAYFHILDADQMRAAWTTWRTAKQENAECVVTFDEDGTPVGIRKRDDE